MRDNRMWQTVGARNDTQAGMQIPLIFCCFLIAYFGKFCLSPFQACPQGILPNHRHEFLQVGQTNKMGKTCSPSAMMTSTRQKVMIFQIILEMIFLLHHNSAPMEKMKKLSKVFRQRYWVCQSILKIVGQNGYFLLFTLSITSPKAFKKYQPIMNNTMYAFEKAKSKSVEYSIFKKSISNEPFLVLFTRV